MEFEEENIKEKLKEYTQNDIEFLKEEWQTRIIQKDFDYFKKLKSVNIQVVYDILDLSKIKKIRESRKGRFVIVLEHSNNYEIEVIIRFDSPIKGKLGIITYYKQRIKQ